MAGRLVSKFEQSVHQGQYLLHLFHALEDEHLDDIPR
jgi:hypothetical protein